MYTNLPTGVPGVFAHVTWNERLGYPLKLTGYAVDPNGVRLDGANSIRRTVNRPEELEIKKQSIANIVSQNCLVGLGRIILELRRLCWAILWLAMLLLTIIPLSHLPKQSTASLPQCELLPPKIPW